MTNKTRNIVLISVFIPLILVYVLTISLLLFLKPATKYKSVNIGLYNVDVPKLISQNKTVYNDITKIKIEFKKANKNDFNSFKSAHTFEYFKTYIKLGKNDGTIVESKNVFFETKHGRFYNIFFEYDNQFFSLNNLKFYENKISFKIKNALDLELLDVEGERL